ADKAKLRYRLVYRQPGDDVPVPSLMHFKVGHFAAVLGEADGHFHLEDAAIAGRHLWMPKAALDAEASGYFLVPDDAPIRSGWRSVDRAEAAKVWGKGNSLSTQLGFAGDPYADASADDPNADEPKCPMCTYNIRESSVSLTLSDSPVGYRPAIGPSAKVRITYNQREDS